MIYAGLIYKPVLIYTDACHMHGVCTGCTVLAGERIPVVYEPVHYPLSRGSAEAEVLSAITGLQRAPRGRPLKLLTDLDLLLRPEWKKKRPVTPEHQSALELFYEEIKAHPRLEIERVNRKHKFYNQCHVRARALARGVWRKSIGVKLEKHDIEPVARRIVQQLREFDERQAMQRAAPVNRQIGWSESTGWRKNWPDG